MWYSLRNFVRLFVASPKRLHSTLGYLTPLEMEMKLRGINKIAA
jgi:hypothetical protein